MSRSPPSRAAGLSTRKCTPSQCHDWPATHCVIGSRMRAGSPARRRACGNARGHGGGAAGMVVVAVADHQQVELVETPARAATAAPPPRPGRTRTDSARRRRTAARARACAPAPTGPAPRRAPTTGTRPRPARCAAAAAAAGTAGSRSQRSGTPRGRNSHKAPSIASTSAYGCTRGRYHCAPGQRPCVRAATTAHGRCAPPATAPAWPAAGTPPATPCRARRSGTITKLTSGTAIRLDKRADQRSLAEEPQRQRQQRHRHHQLAEPSARARTRASRARAIAGTASGTPRRRRTARSRPPAPPADRPAGSRSSASASDCAPPPARRLQRASATTAIISKVRTVGRPKPASAL